jgi:uncharacterized membrane protein YkgB
MQRSHEFCNSTGAIDMLDLGRTAAKYLPYVLALFNAAIFLDSLRYKFTDHPKTQEIFGRLDGWSASFGARGLFGRTGIFSQYVIGSAELVASVLMLAGLFAPGYGFLLPVGALLGLAIMAGAISFHLFTPLGVDPNKDGGGLFRAACLVWVSCLALLVMRVADLQTVANKVLVLMTPVGS